MPLIYVEKEDTGDKHYEIQPGSYKYFRTRVQTIELFTHAIWGRMLFMNGMLQSTTFDEAIYHKALTSTLPFSGSVLILGGGEGATAREILKYNDVECVEMVDWDEAFVRHMQEYEPDWSQGAFENPKLTFRFADVFEWIQTNTKKYDYILVDLFDPEEFSFEEWGKLCSALKVFMKKGIVFNGGRIPYSEHEKENFLNPLKLTFEERDGWKLSWSKKLIPSFQSEWIFFTLILQV